MVRRIPIRAKVAGALTVPLLALVVVAGIGASTNARTASRVVRQADMATASIGHAGLISALQAERNLALLDMLGLTGRLELDAPDADAARAMTDGAVTALHREIAGHGGTLREDYRVALDSLGRLDEVRGAVDGVRRAAPGSARQAAHDAFASYTEMIRMLFASHDRFSLVVDNAALRQGDELMHYSSHGADASAQLLETLLFLGSGPGGIDEPTEAAQVAAVARDVERNSGVLRTKGTGPYADATAALFANPRLTGLADYAHRAVRTGQVEPDTLLATAPLGPEGGYAAFRDEVVGILDAEAARLGAEADRRRQWYVTAAAAALGAAVLIAWLVSRSITRPLRRLGEEAGAMASYRLPAAVQDILDTPRGQDIEVPEARPIATRARDEVGDVARALDEVQSSALRLAVEQAALRRNVAESYVNLGRRNQNLLSRLLDSVTELESSESDPDRLDQLYKLEHLATRIRRNAESLLVLSEPVAPARWQPPVQVADVVRAALGEIENYERVVVRTLEPVMLRGGASADLAHLLAELIENGLRHSPPRELVEVSGRLGSGGYTLSVVDHGLGMTAEDLELANQRLAGTESFTVTPARYLGHYVTAVLAARHGISVRLGGSVVLGITARIELPASILTDHAEHPAGPTRQPDGERPSPAGWGALDTAGERPSADDVRAAVALLRTRSATPPKPPVRVPPVPVGAIARSTTVVPRHWPARSERDRHPAPLPSRAPTPAVVAAPGPNPGPGAGRRGLAGGPRPRPAVDTAGRTASGLVRRVPRARGEAGDQGGGTRPELERFLSSLAGRMPPAGDAQDRGTDGRGG
ncbi:MAG TPA: ATP-binding protein [Acidimicrobiales bacterium]|nr:ATP-binding protein [Acidimicrobiales bacterium]